jgi:exonuclease SbcC
MQRQCEEALVLKINSLSIENFRSHKKTEINLDRINFFAGGNNAGKTSILAAIEWALTGHCLWTDRAGRGAADLVRQGEKCTAVALDVAGLGAVIRSLPLKLLSKSEQLRVGIAVSEALSAAAGLKFLAIDEADILEQDNRDLLAGMLLDTAAEFDQVLVFTTVGDVRP